MSLLLASVIAFFVCLTVPSSLAKYAESCVTPVGDRGKCVPVKSCGGAYELLQNILKYGEEKFKNEILILQQSRCESKDIPLICCPHDNIQINTDVYNHLKSLNCGSSGSAKVAKGDPAGLFDFRWMALLKYEGKEPFACGGTLIDERHVLTAAHCFHNDTNLPIAVRLGEYDLNNETDCSTFGRRRKCLKPVEDIGIKDFIIHEDYVYNGLYHDIAILRLERPVKINTKSIRPICLPLSEELQSEIPNEFLVAGWGMTEYGYRSNVLLWTSIPNRSHDFCEEHLGLVLSHEHICAGGRRFRDTCKGDSGGPLFLPNIYVDGVVRAIQYGVVSIGVGGCGELSEPAVYTNVPDYIQWITDHMIIEEADYYIESKMETSQPSFKSQTETPPPQLESQPEQRSENSAYSLNSKSLSLLSLLLSIFLTFSHFS